MIIQLAIFSLDIKIFCQSFILPLRPISQTFSLHLQLRTNSRNHVSCSFMMHFTVFGRKFSFIIEESSGAPVTAKRYPFFFPSLLIDKAGTNKI